jgi:hypothetical protein
VAFQEAGETWAAAAGDALRGSADAESLAFGSGLLSTASIMKTAQSLLSMRPLRSFSVSFLAFIAAASLLPAQDAVYPPQKPTPAKIEAHIFLLGESVIREQWAHTLNLVNAPQNVTLLNPGQCVRVGVLATGDNRDNYLEKTKLSFNVNFAGQTQEHPLVSLTQTKQIKPEGADFVTVIATSAGVKIPNLSMASMGVSADNWCAPVDVGDGKATVEAEIETPTGHQTLKRATIQIESYETGSKRSFKDEEEMERFLMTYYREPNPARLLPLLQFFAADTKARENRGTPESIAASIGSALKADPVAAKDFMTRISAQTGFTRAFGMLALLYGGYDIEPVLKTMNEEHRQMFTHHPILPDPYEMAPDGENATRLDILWGIYTTTGQYAPVEKIASTLAWRSDWDAFDKLRKTPNHPTDWTPSIARAVTYGAAGWALGSFQRNDPLTADYIEYMLASPDISDSVKTELKGLLTNPAFKENDKK